MFQGQDVWLSFILILCSLVVVQYNGRLSVGNNSENSLLKGL